MSILLRSAVVDGALRDLLIEGNRFARIAARIDGTAEKVIDCAGKLAVTLPFYNTHIHAAMTLLRGYADDMELFTWLNDYIWPAEAKLSEEDIHIGSRLAGLEMIRSGTVFFNDMYWHQPATVRAAAELGLRAEVGLLHLSPPGGGDFTGMSADMERLNEAVSGVSSRISVAYAPHAVYTVSEASLRKFGELSAADGRRIHIHVSETIREVEDCKKAHNGLSPIEYLDSLGVLSPRTLLAHCTVLSDHDRELIAQRGAVIAHMPVSNMKLDSGMFDFKAARRAGCRITLGTDGCSSNNNLSMIEEMKFAALVAKIRSDDPTAGSARDIFHCATAAGAEAFGIDAGIAEGKLADALLIDLDTPQMTGHDFIADMVYSADSSVVDSVICDGKVLMEHRRVEGAEEIVSEARAVCRRIGRRAKNN